MFFWHVKWQFVRFKGNQKNWTQRKTVPICALLHIQNLFWINLMIQLRNSDEHQDLSNSSRKDGRRRSTAKGSVWGVYQFLSSNRPACSIREEEKTSWIHQQEERKLRGTYRTHQPSHKGCIGNINRAKKQTKTKGNWPLVSTKDSSSAPRTLTQ